MTMTLVVLQSLGIGHLSPGKYEQPEHNEVFPASFEAPVGSEKSYKVSNKSWRAS